MIFVAKFPLKSIFRKVKYYSYFRVHMYELERNIALWKEFFQCPLKNIFALTASSQRDSNNKLALISGCTFRHLLTANNEQLSARKIRNRRKFSCFMPLNWTKKGVYHAEVAEAL